MAGNFRQIKESLVSYYADWVSKNLISKNGLPVSDIHIVEIGELFNQGAIIEVNEIKYFFLELMDTIDFSTRNSNISGLTRYLFLIFQLNSKDHGASIEELILENDVSPFTLRPSDEFMTPPNLYVAEKPTDFYSFDQDKLEKLSDLPNGMIYRNKYLHPTPNTEIEDLVFMLKFTIPN